MGRKNKGPEIRRLLAENVSFSDTVRRVPCAKSTVNYHAKQMGLAKFLSVYKWADVQAFYDAGNDRAACIARFGFCGETWIAAVKRGDLKVSDWRLPLEKLLVVGRHQTARSHLKGRLLQAGLLVNHCYECGITEWRGKSLSLHLHHINGDGSDNRLENLTLLCPNCHSQTENFAGKNKPSHSQRHPKEKTDHAFPTL